MPSNERAKTIFPAAVLILAMAVAATTHGAAAAAECQNQDVGISLSPGFCATVFADNLGHVRHLAVSSDNVVYANSWSGRYYHNDTPPAGGFLLAIKDTTGSGKAAVIQRFGPDKSTGAAGGTGVALYNGALYAELNDKIVRYVRTTGEIAPSSKAETVLSGMPLTGDHPMHPFVIDATGNLFVDLGSATNACQAANRMPLSPGHDPCIELETRAGIWRYDANKTDQTFSASERYATGIRNGEGFAFDKAGRELAQALYGRAGRRASVIAALLQLEDLLGRDGRNAITTRIRKSWSWRRNMAATAARRLESVLESRSRSPPFPAIGRPTTC